MTKLSRFFVIISTVLSLLAIVSCSALFGGDDSDDDVEYSADGKSYITINAKALSRTLMPTAKLADLTSIKLTGSLDGVEKTDPLLEVDTYADLSSAKVEIETGTWEFTLCANYGEAVLKGSTTQEIKSGTVNKLTFVLKGEASYGGLNIALKIKSGTADTVTATLMTADKTETVATKDLTLTDGEAFFTRSITSETERLASGTYYILFEFKYGSTVLNTSEHYVRIAKGFTTSSTIELDLNALYTITYKYYVNGELFEDAAEAGVSPASTTDVLSTKYSRKDEDITLPKMKKSGYQFIGWYADESLEEAKETIAKGSAGNITLYGCFINGITVNATSGKENPNIFVGEAANSVETAITAINAINQSELDWTIYIDGEIGHVSITGGVSADGTDNSIKAKSLILKGKTGNTVDAINGSIGVVSSASVALYVSGDCDVIVENLKITGGNGSQGGGVYVGESSMVTLGTGCLVTGNESGFGDTQGGGVYVTNSGKLILQGARIEGNTVPSGNHGAGVYCKGRFNFGGSSVVAEDNDVYLDDTTICVTSDLTGDYPVACINTNREQVLIKLSNDKDYVKTNYNKFKVIGAVPETSGEDGSWGVNENGYVVYRDKASNIISVTFDGADEEDLQIIAGSSTVNLAGTLQEMGANDVRTFGVNNGFASITWSVDGEKFETSASSVSGFSIESNMLKATKSNMVEGVYDITVTASKDSKTYSASFQLKK